MSGSEELAAGVKQDYHHADLSPLQLALCEFAEKLTLRPRDMSAEDVERLRAAGLGDRAILDAVEVVAYFNYINRVASALNVDPEPKRKSHET